MAVIVTGGAGIIGAETVRQLVARGETVVAADLRPPKLPVDIAGKVRFARVDVSIFEEVLDLVMEVKPTRIYHFAAMLSQEAERRHALAFRVNVMGAHNIMEAARIGGVPRLLYVSSIGVYGRDLPDVIDDYSLQRPDIHYGCAKLFGENLGRWYFDKFKLDVRAIRYPMVAGVGDRALAHWSAPMIEDAIARRHHTCVEAARNSTSILITEADSGRAAIELLEAPVEKIKTRCYTVLGMKQSTVVEDLGRELEKRYPGFKAEYTREQKPKLFRVIDDRYAREEWGWKPSHDTLDKLLAHFEARVKEAA